MNIKPITKLHGTLKLSGSKSILQRILLISLFLKDEMSVTNWSDSEDVREMAKAIGVEAIENQVTLNDTCLRSRFHIEESATALRFLMVYASLQAGKETIISIGERLSERPHDELIKTMITLGATIAKNNRDIVVLGANPKVESLVIDAGISSQYISALLLCAPCFEKGLTIQINSPIVSKNYIDLTIALMDEFGIQIEEKESTYIIPAQSRYNAKSEFTCEADLSSAVYPLSLGLFSEEGIGVTPISNHTKQPDFVFWKLLSDAGADIKLHYTEKTEETVLIAKKSDYKGFNFNARRAPDLVPVLSILALFATTETVIYNVGYLKHKESDRVTGIIENLKLIGAEINLDEDMLKINPLTVEPNEIELDSYNDHRLAMSFYILNQLFPQVSVNSMSSVKKSYSNFVSDINSLR